MLSIDNIIQGGTYMVENFHITEKVKKRIFEVLETCPYITSVDTILKRAGISSTNANYKIYKDFVINSQKYKLNQIKTSRIVVYYHNNSLYGKFSSLVYNLEISLDELYKAIDNELNTKPERNILFIIKNAVYSITGIENILTDLNKWERVALYIRQNPLYHKDFSKLLSYVLFSGNSIWQINGDSRKRICFETTLKKVEEIESKYVIKSPKTVVKKALSSQRIVLDSEENLIYNKLIFHVIKLREKKENMPVLEFYFGQLQLRYGNVYTPLLIPEEIISRKMTELLPKLQKERYKVLKDVLKEITGIPLVRSDGDPLYEKYLNMVSSKKYTNNDKREYQKFENQKLREERENTYYHSPKRGSKKNYIPFPFDSHVTQLSTYKMS